MLDDTTANFESVYEGAHDCRKPLDIRAVLRDSSLPKELVSAPISYVRERMIDSREIEQLSRPKAGEQDDPVVMERLGKRRSALRAHLRSSLTCVVIRLPGASYTIEIDPVDRKIVHWEWHRT